MTEEYKINGVDRWSLRYSDKNVEFTIGKEGAFKITEPGKPAEIIGVTVDENNIHIVRGVLSKENLEIERIKSWLLTEGGYSAIVPIHLVIDSDDD